MLLRRGLGNGDCVPAGMVVVRETLETAMPAAASNQSSPVCMSATARRFARHFGCGIDDPELGEAGTSKAVTQRDPR